VRVHRHLPTEEASEILTSKRRFQVINLWRPISHPAWDHPLAMCDYRSVDPEKDLVASDLIFPHYKGETFGVKESPKHKWKYVSGLRPDEHVLLKW
jgi:hypothetical protein